MALRRLSESDKEIEATISHVHSFVHMLRQLQGENLAGWLEEVEEHGSAELRSFAQGLRKEYSAVKAGLTLAWSNGPTEAQIQRLKLLKRHFTEVSYHVVFYCVNELLKLVGTSVKDKRDEGRTQGV